MNRNYYLTMQDLYDDYQSEKNIKNEQKFSLCIRKFIKWFR